MDRLDHVVTDNLKNDKDWSNEEMNSDPTFDTRSFNLSRGTSNPLPVITVSLQVGKKHRASLVAGLKLLWGSRDTNNMIKILYTKHY